MFECIVRKLNNGALETGALKFDKFALCNEFINYDFTDVFKGHGYINELNLMEYFECYFNGNFGFPASNIYEFRVREVETGASIFTMSFWFSKYHRREISICLMENSINNDSERYSAVEDYLNAFITKTISWRRFLETKVNPYDAPKYFLSRTFETILRCKAEEVNKNNR